MTEKKWYRWPQNYYKKNWKPWYGILRALLAAPFVYIGFSVMYLGIVISEGISGAEWYRKDLF